MVLIGLVGGFITAVSPCILPVLPVIFLSAGAQGTAGDRRRPYLVVAGLVLSFSLITLVGALILDALPLPEDTIRWAGLAALLLLGLAMMFPRVETLLERPFTAIPQRRVGSDRGAFVLGLALGAVFVPCAGPVLAAITVAGATGRIGAQTVALTAAFAVGTAIPLLAFALAGRGAAERIHAFREHERGLRIGAGVVVIGLAVALTFNVTDALQRDVPDYTSGLNSALGKGLAHGDGGARFRCAEAPDSVPQECGPAPVIAGIQEWLNTAHGAPELKGKVVLVDFWAYSCINCQRATPHLNGWYTRYRSDGFEVVGVHTPEYAFEHVPANVAAGAKRLGISYPVALDNRYTTWNNFDNNAWPAEYLIDRSGTVRHVAIGEGDYDATESVIRTLLEDGHPDLRLPPRTHVSDTTPISATQTPETYLGTQRASNYSGDTDLRTGVHGFSFPAQLPADSFGLRGEWSVSDEELTACRDSVIRLNFTARDVYLDVGGTGTVRATVDGRTTTYRIFGAPNIYTLVHGKSPRTGTLTVTLSRGLQAYSFTFG